MGGERECFFFDHTLLCFLFSEKFLFNTFFAFFGALLRFKKSLNVLPEFEGKIY